MVAEGYLEEIERYQPSWTILLRPIQTFVGLLPSHKNTRKGRRTARQIKIVVIVLAFIAVIAAQSTPVMVIGIVALAIAPLIPISQVRKRSWINRLKSLRDGRDRTVEHPARVTFDGRRVSLLRDDQRIRRVLVDRDDHVVSTGEIDDRLYLKVAPDSGNKDEAVWVGTTDVSADQLPDDRTLEDLSADELAKPVYVGGREWRELTDRLRSNDHDAAG